jgi:hypothetical protein
MRCSYYPQSLAQVRGAIWEIEVWIGGVDPRVLFTLSCLGYTGLTGANHLWDLPRVNCWTRVSLGRGVAGMFLVYLELFLLGIV